MNTWAVGSSIVIGWLLVAGASFLLLADSWREEFDLTRSDARSFAWVSVIFGPVALGAALVIWGHSRLTRRNRKNGNEILVPKKERESA